MQKTEKRRSSEIGRQELASGLDTEWYRGANYQVFGNTHRYPLFTQAVRKRLRSVSKAKAFNGDTVLYKPGVYVMWDKGAIVYVGKSYQSMGDRVREHLFDRRKKFSKARGDLTVLFNVFGTHCETIIDYLEAKLIREYRPKWNTVVPPDRLFKKLEAAMEELLAITGNQQGLKQ